MAAKFEPAKKENTGDNGNQSKMNAYKRTTFKEMVEFLAEKGTKEDRKEFKRNCYLAIKKEPTGRKDKNGKEIMKIVKDENGKPVMEETGKLNWLYAKRKFFEKYAPEYISSKKNESLADLIKDW